jgi:hypothetical protein
VRRYLSQGDGVRWVEIMGMRKFVGAFVVAGFAFRGV